MGSRIAAVGAAVVVVAAASFGVSRVAGASGGPDVAAPAAAAGTIVTASAPSKALRGTIDYNIYLPAGYEGSGRRYPSLYLLHGRGDTMAAWTREKADLDRLIANGSIPPLIVVMPDAPWAGGGSWYVDSRYTGKDFPAVRAETALTRDLVQHIDARYRTLDDRASRAIGGYSMGGYGALRYALAHQDVFSAGLVLSPAVYTPQPPRDSSTRDYGAFGVGRAKFDADRYTALNYPKLLTRVDPDLPLHFFLAVGDDEYINPKPVDAKHDLDFETSVAFNALKRVPGVTAEMRELDGGHDWDVWTPAFVEGVTDIAAHLTTGDEPPPMTADLLGTAGDEWAGGVVPDPDGGSTVALATSGSLGGSSAGGLDVVVTRRSAAGAAIWTTQFGNDANQRAYGVAAGADGRVYVAGYTGGNLDGAHAGNAADDGFVAALAADGTREWVIQFGSAAAADRVYAATADGAGGLYVTGYTKGSIDGTTTNAGDKDVFVARVAAGGTVSWARQFGSAGEDKGLAVTRLGDGVAVAGVAGGALPGTSSPGGADGFVAAFDGAGGARDGPTRSVPAPGICSTASRRRRTARWSLSAQRRVPWRAPRPGVPMPSPSASEPTAPSAGRGSGARRPTMSPSMCCRPTPEAPGWSVPPPGPWPVPLAVSTCSRPRSARTEPSARPPSSAPPRTTDWTRSRSPTSTPRQPPTGYGSPE